MSTEKRLQMNVLHLRGVEVEFPFDPYPEQVQYMDCVIQSLQTGKNALLESPTGTGKTLCLLCATLAWRRSEIKKRADAIKKAATLVEGAEPDYPFGWSGSNVVPGKEDESSHQVPAAPRIIYASRTHSQLAQVVKELKRTSYAKDTKISILGSREQMCIHPEVSKQSNNTAMIHSCRNKVSKHLCHFYNNVENVRKAGCFSNEVLDIEELVNLGKKRNACPYYVAREQSKEADCGIIFTPYNYLLDRKSRRANNLEVSGNVIIFDEAHNLERICEESASFDLTSMDIAKCINETGELLQAAVKMSETGVVPDGYEAGESTALSEFSLQELATLKALFVQLENCLHEIPLDVSKKCLSKPGRFMFEFLAPLNITFSTHEVVIDLVDKVVSYLSTLSNSFQTRGTALQKLSEVLKTIFSAAGGDNPTLPSTLIHSSYATNIMMDDLSKFYRVHIREEEMKPTKKSWGSSKTTLTSSSASSSSTHRVLSYWCFSPGYAMRDLLAVGVRNLILTSGTLSPIESFTCELQVDFPITLQNTHVIDDHQVFVAAVKKTLSHRRLESTFKTRNDYGLAQDIGNYLVRLSEICPGGLLVFFPSYASMEGYIKKWEELSPNIMRQIDLRKPCTVESKNKNSLKDSMDKFYSDVANPQGASFFAICRGKVSEGLDFTNNNGRAVVIIGLPFPPAKDPKVNEKMDFLQALRASGGKMAIDSQKWYRLQALRAVNQAIGRVIRHRYDYGAIVLLDYRYAERENFMELPKWIRPRLVEFDDAEKALRRFKSFFCSVQLKEKARLRSLNNEGDGASRKSLVGTSGDKSSDKKIFFGGQQGNSSKTSPYFTQSSSLNMRKDKSFLAIPKTNDISNHIPPSVIANMTDPHHSTPGGSCSVCPGSGKKRRLPEKEESPNLVPIKNYKKAKAPSLFDVLNKTKAKSPQDTVVKESVAEDESKKIVRELLIRDKMLDDQRRGLVKKKIKLKPNKDIVDQNKAASTGIATVTTPLNDSTSALQNHTLESCGSDDLLDERMLINGRLELFLSSLRKVVKGKSYHSFKELLSTFSSINVSMIVEKLSEILLRDENSKILFRAFIRFFKNKKKVEEFADSCMRVTGKRPVGY